MDSKDNSSTLIEVYKQEMENIRFFEDVFFKLHFFCLSGFVIISGYLFEKKIILNPMVLFFAFLIILCVLILVFETDKKHTARMRRLVKIQNLIGLNVIYGDYKKLHTGRAIMFISLYAILLTMTVSVSVYKSILSLLTC